MVVCHCCQLEPVKRGTILSRALDMVNSVGSMESASECNNGQMSSTYILCLASGCYSDEKEDKSDGRRYNSERRRCKSDVEEDKSYRGGVQHLRKRKEDIGGEGIGFSLCAAPLDRLSPHISEEQSCDRGVGVELEEELIVRQKQDEDGALLIFVLRYEEIHRGLYTN